MLYMIVELFKDGDPVPVYRRFQQSGRMAPGGLRYISSWVDADLTRCFQLMETADIELLHLWMENWSDIVDFEIYPVMSSQAAVKALGSKL